MIDQKRMQREFLALSYVQATISISIFMVFWTLLASLMTVMAVIIPITRQIPTYWFASVQGIVTHSKVQVHRGDKPNTFSIDIGYEYTVDGQTLTGEQFRYSPMGSNDSYAEKFVKEHPAGSSITVYFDPKKSKESVLVRGIEGSDLFAAFFLLPFNLIAVMGWYLVTSHFRYWNKRTIWRTRTRISGIEQPSNGFPNVLLSSSFGVGLIVAILLSLLLMFAMSVLTGSHPSIGVAVTAWIVVLGTALIVASVFPSSNRNRWIYCTLEMNERVVRVYRLGRSRPLAELPFDDVKSIKVYAMIDEKRGSDATREYELQAIATSVGELTLTSFRDLEEAKRNAQLLAGELKVSIELPAARQE